ncbi:MAG: hypothetical protein AAB638_01660 [Patescibacteria group bacterium]
MWLQDLLVLFDITPDKYPFLVLGILIIASAGYIRFSIGRKLGKIKDNVLIVITHLSSSASRRGRLDTSLIQVMSPMTITDKGHTLLADSGLKRILAVDVHREEFMSNLSDQKPKTKLDVESLAIVSFSTFLEKEFMNPIKTYLYDHPNEREVFSILAGLYIRDEYLKIHPEITQ